MSDNFGYAKEVHTSIKQRWVFLQLVSRLHIPECATVHIQGRRQLPKRLVHVERPKPGRKSFDVCFCTGSRPECRICRLNSKKTLGEDPRTPLKMALRPHHSAEAASGPWYQIWKSAVCAIRHPDEVSQAATCAQLNISCFIARKSAKFAWFWTSCFRISVFLCDCVHPLTSKFKRLSVSKYPKSGQTRSPAQPWLVTQLFSVPVAYKPSEMTYRAQITLPQEPSRVAHSSLCTLAGVYRSSLINT